MSLKSVFDSFNEDDEYEEQKRAGYIHAPINYCGSKYESLAEILEALPHEDTFVDVFGGSGQVILAKKPCALDVYNDINSGLSALYRVIQDKEMLAEFLTRVECLRQSREVFYAFKEELAKAELSLVDRAVRWYYLVQMSFGGRGIQFRRVKKGKNAILDKLYAHFEEFEHYHNRFRNVCIENMDYRRVFEDYDSHHTVFYCDPPYWESPQYASNMAEKDHRIMCDKIFELKGFVALSGYDNHVYSQYPWDDVLTLTVKSTFLPSEFSHRGEGRKESRFEHLYIKEAR